MFSIPVLIEHDLVPGFQMHLDGTHLLGDILARALYQPLAQIGGELRPGVGGYIDAAAQRAAHVGGNLPDGIHLHRVGNEDAALSIRVIHRQFHRYDRTCVLPFKIMFRLCVPANERLPFISCTPGNC